jgi:molybdate transport system regulatory protein
LEFGLTAIFVYNPRDMKTKPARIHSLQPRLRVRVGDEIALGPGKVELLELVQQTGSITEAARQMGMSYMRAWTLIRTMNGCFKQPLTIAVRGGSKGGGGAKLSATGHEALALYHQMSGKCLEVTQSDWKQLQKLLSR